MTCQGLSTLHVHRVCVSTARLIADDRFEQQGETLFASLKLDDTSNLMNTLIAHLH